VRDFDASNATEQHATISNPNNDCTDSIIKILNMWKSNYERRHPVWLRIKKIVPARGKRLVTKIERQHVQSCPTSHVTDLPVIVDVMAEGQ
jgi:hypothetical protein